MGDVFDIELLLAVYSLCIYFYTKRTSHVSSVDKLPLPFRSAPEKYNRMSFIRHALHELQFLWPCTLT